jgi:hypothetical protein
VDGFAAGQPELEVRHGRGFVAPMRVPATSPFRGRQGGSRRATVQ